MQICPRLRVRAGRIPALQKNESSRQSRLPSLLEVGSGLFMSACLTPTLVVAAGPLYALLSVGASHFVPPRWLGRRGRGGVRGRGANSRRRRCDSRCRLGRSGVGVWRSSQRRSVLRSGRWSPPSQLKFWRISSWLSLLIVSARTHMISFQLWASGMPVSSVHTR